MDYPKEIQVKIERALALEKQIADQIASLKDAQDSLDNFWKLVEEGMIESDIKNIKGEWGSLTIAERLGWNTTDELPKKFYKKIVDTKKLSDTYRLVGKSPKGATPYTTKFLQKRIKGDK